MAERKSGPVKPPVIDLKAREAAPRNGGTPADATAAPEADGKSAGKPKATAAATAPKPEKPEKLEKPEKPAAEAAKPAPAESGSGPAGPKSPPPGPPPRPPARLAMPWSAISIAAVTGALLGAVLVYLLAAWLPLPGAAPPIADPAARLAALDEADAALGQRLAELEERAVDTQQSLDATIQQLDSGLAGLRTALDELRQTMPEPVNGALADITTQLQTLDSRLDAMAAGASSSDAAALAESLAGIEDTMARYGDRLQAFEAQLAAGDAGLAAVRGRLDDLGAAVTAQSSTLAGGDVAPAARLPLIVSGLEAAFASGRPYAVELRSLTGLLPELAVPPAIAAASETGLSRPEVLVRRFNEQLPAILAGRTASTSGDWTENALEWAKALLALRPAEEIEGDSPEAVISRLEAAMERRDFVAAAGLMAELPAPMREAAGALAADILLHAEADTFITGLRAQALAPPPVAPELAPPAVEASP